MKRNIKLKGRLRNYMYWPMILTILLAVFNVPVYMINTKSGCVVTVFTVIYFIVVCLSYNYNKPVLVNELISFATQYGSAQKKLLEEFEIPYAQHGTGESDRLIRAERGFFDSTLYF